MRNTVRKIIAAVGGILLAAGIACCFASKDDDLIGLVIIFGIVYVIYVIALTKKLKKEAETNKQSPLKKR